MRPLHLFFLSSRRLPGASLPCGNEQDILNFIKAGTTSTSSSPEGSQQSREKGDLANGSPNSWRLSSCGLRQTPSTCPGQHVELYGIKPEGDTVNGGLVGGVKTYWKPKFYDNNAGFKRVEDKYGFYHYLRFDQVVAATPGKELYVQVAQTIDNGEVAVRYEGFKIAAAIGNPRYLASQVYHESVHYARLTSTGWGDGPLAWAEDEEAIAYEEELKKADDFHLTRDEKQAIKELRDEAKVAKRETPAYTTPSKSDYNGGIYNDPRMQYPDQLARIQGEIKELSESLRRARERRERRAESDRRLRWIKLKEWSMYMCLYMRGTQYGDREWGNPKEIEARDRAYRDYVLTHYVVLPKDELDAGLICSDEFYIDKLCQPWFIQFVGTIPTDVEGSSQDHV